MVSNSGSIWNHKQLMDLDLGLLATILNTNKLYFTVLFLKSCYSKNLINLYYIPITLRLNGVLVIVFVHFINEYIYLHCRF